jgi:hypothetical protein
MAVNLLSNKNVRVRASTCAYFSFFALKQVAKNFTFFHSERSEESLLLFLARERREIPRFARNDKAK